MPFDVEMPDGTVIQDVPDGTTKAQLQAKYSAHVGGQSPNMLADAAKSFPSGIGKGLAGLAGMGGDIGDVIGSGMRAVGIPTRDTSKPLPDTVTLPGQYLAPDSKQAAKDISAPFGGFHEPQTRLGRIAETAGAFLPAVAGGEASLGKRLMGRVLAPAAGNELGGELFSAQDHPILNALGHLGGTALGAGAVGGARALGAALKGDRETLPPTIKPMAAEANAAGYTLAPRMISDKPGLLADALAGWSGKIKTGQAASARNQEVTNNLAATDLGLPEGTPLTDNVFKDVRSEAGKAYAALPTKLPNVTADKQFTDNITTLGGANSAAAAEFPDIMRNADVEKLVSGLSNKAQFPTSAAMEVVKKLRKDATSNFRAQGDAQKLELAHSQRSAANEIDDLIERNLAATGDDASVQNYKDARQLIAKSYDLEAATNTSTGNVSARKIAALSNRGRPLSGGTKTIGDVANAFPRAMQSESAFGETEPLSVLDMGAAALSAAHGAPALGAAILGKPAARSILLSAPVQNRLVGSALKERTQLKLPPPARDASLLGRLLMENR